MEPTDSYDEAEVEEFLRAIAVPRRLREPRAADLILGAPPTTTITTRWGDVAAWRVGAGPAVLLVHGWEDDNSLWSPLADELRRRERAAVLFDLPAHGASTGEWAVSFEGSDALRAVAGELGPIDAVVAHSFGCGVTAGAMWEGWQVERVAFIAPPLAAGDRWLRYAERLDVRPAVATEAKRRYQIVHGPARAAWSPRDVYPTLDTELLVVQSRDDERSNPADTEAVIPLHPRSRLELVDGLTHRRTARDPAVIELVCDFVAPAGRQ